MNVTTAITDVALRREVGRIDEEAVGRDVDTVGDHALHLPRKPGAYLDRHVGVPKRTLIPLRVARSTIARSHFSRS